MDTELATNVTAIASLLVGLGALLISIGILYLVMRIGNAVDRFSGTNNSDGTG